MSEKKFTITLTIAITLCLSFLINSILITNMDTRRADDVIIKIHEETSRTKEYKIKSCVDSGGIPDYYNGNFTDCKRSN